MILTQCKMKNEFYNNPTYFKDSCLNRCYVCANCGVKQKIFDNFVFSGFCFNNSKEDAHPTWKCGKLELLPMDEISFKCHSCKKISLNVPINGEPLFLLPKLSNEEIKLMEILDQHNKENNDLIKLLKEFFISTKINHNSSATMLARKVLMHFAVELGTKNIENFKEAVEYIKSTNILGSNWNKQLEKIRKFGNQENHEIKIASNEEIQKIKLIMKQLIQSHYLPQELITEN